MFTRVTAVLAVAVALAISTPAMADHVFTIKNNCDKTITPSLTNTGGPFTQLRALKKGETVTTSVPEGWLSGRVFGQTGSCSKPDGAGCTLLECDFSNPSFRQCNLSRVSGYNVPMGFSYDASNCGSNNCASSSCNGNAAFSTPTNGGNSIRQCNNANVGMHIHFC